MTGTGYPANPRESPDAEVRRLRATLHDLHHPGDPATGPTAYDDNPAVDRLTPAEVDHVAALGLVAHMYIAALDDDPEHDMLTLPEAIAVTAVRDALAWTENVTRDWGEREDAAFAERTARTDPGGTP